MIKNEEQKISDRDLSFSRGNVVHVDHPLYILTFASNSSNKFSYLISKHIIKLSPFLRNCNFKI